MNSPEPDATEIATRARRFADQELSPSGDWSRKKFARYSVELALERAFIAGAQFVLDEMKVLRK